MEVIITHTIAETSVTLIDETYYAPQSKTDYASIMYVNNKKTTGDSPIIIPPDPNAQEWVLLNLGDGYYKAELLVVPTFEYVVNSSTDSGFDDIFTGTVVYYDGLFYRAVKNITNNGDVTTPDIDYNNWEEISITYVHKVYNETIMNGLPEYARTSYGFVEFMFYNNLVYSFINLSAEITKSCNICTNPQIELLRCLRDKYESVELAVAAGNYSGAQTIIESSQNLENCCSC